MLGNNIQHRHCDVTDEELTEVGHGGSGTVDLAPSFPSRVPSCGGAGTDSRWRAVQVGTVGYFLRGGKYLAYAIFRMYELFKFVPERLYFNHQKTGLTSPNRHHRDERHALTMAEQKQKAAK